MPVSKSSEVCARKTYKWLPVNRDTIKINVFGITASTRFLGEEDLCIAPSDTYITSKLIAYQLHKSKMHWKYD